MTISGCVKLADFFDFGGPSLGSHLGRGLKRADGVPADEPGEEDTPFFEVGVPVFLGDFARDLDAEDVPDDVGRLDVDGDACGFVEALPVRVAASDFFVSSFLTLFLESSPWKTRNKITSIIELLIQFLLQCHDGFR